MRHWHREKSVLTLLSLMTMRFSRRRSRACRVSISCLKLACEVFFPSAWLSLAARPSTLSSRSSILSSLPSTAWCHNTHKHPLPLHSILSSLPSTAWCHNTHKHPLPLHSNSPAPVAQWLARRTVGRKVWGSNPIRVMWDFSALAGSYPELGVLWAQWEGWNHTAELHPLHGCVFEGVALITWPTLQVSQFPGLVNTGIIMTVSVVCGPVK